MADFTKDRAELKAVLEAIYYPPADYKPSRLPPAYLIRPDSFDYLPDPYLEGLEKDWRHNNYILKTQSILCQYTNEDTLRAVRDLASAVANEYGYMDWGPDIYAEYRLRLVNLNSDEMLTEGGLPILKSKMKPYTFVESESGELVARPNFLDNRSQTLPTNIPLNAQIQPKSKQSKITSLRVKVWGIVTNEATWHNAFGNVFGAALWLLITTAVIGMAGGVVYLVILFFKIIVNYFNLYPLG